MNLNRILITAGVTLAVFLGVPQTETTESGETQVYLGVQNAEAGPAHGTARRTARRTSRRTSRRVARRYNALPSGCVWRAPYHYCGGVYYQAVVENGAEVYIVVTP